MIGFVDCYSGASGDMLLGALIDAGAPLEALEAALAGLSLGGFVRLEVSTVERGGLRASQVSVEALPGQPHRPYRDVVRLVEDARLPPHIRDRSLAVFARIADVEARIHGVALDELELHEVGAIDSIVDIVGTVAGLAALGIDRLHASSLPVSPGSIGGGDHGALPGPAPATLELIASAGAPTRPFGEGHELVTPTGAAILTTLATFDQPPLRITRVGYGAGQAELPWPNVLRLWIGSPVAVETGGAGGRHVVLETNIDDMSAQLLAPVIDRLMAAGALDVTLSPIVMKKGRPATLVSVIADAGMEHDLADLLLSETTTLGVRVHDVRRHEAERSFERVSTPYGEVEVKCRILDGRVVGAMPEFESVRALALAAHVPLVTVHAAAAAAAAVLVETAGEPLGSTRGGPGARA